jgi:hypothetical protein
LNFIIIKYFISYPYSMIVTCILMKRHEHILQSFIHFLFKMVEELACVPLLH